MLAACLLVAGFPVWMAVALVIDLIIGIKRLRSVRVVVFLVFMTWFEIVSLLKTAGIWFRYLGRIRSDAAQEHMQRLVGFYVHGIYAGTCRIFGLRMKVTGTEVFDDGTGVICFGHHTSVLDSVIPVVPSETTVIIGGVAVATGTAPYPLLAVIAAGAAGAFIGDNMAFSIGRHWSDAFERRAQRKPKFAAKLAWAREQIADRGGLLLITARFIPGGRTAITIASGITRQSRAWFVRWTFIAAAIWATYAAGLARLVK